MSTSPDKYGLDKWLISFLREGLYLSNGKPTGGFLLRKAALRGCYKAFDSGDLFKSAGSWISHSQRSTLLYANTGIYKEELLCSEHLLGNNVY